MSTPQATCWTLIDGAARGHERDREDFARRYLPAIEAYLSARWRGGPCIADREDAVQEVFVECFRDGGALGRVERGRSGGFRPFLYGVVRNIARRFESERGRKREIAGESLGDLVEDEATLSKVFDRAWALSRMEEAWGVLESRARDERTRRHVEILRLRFEEDLPVREIARTLSADPARVHEEYRAARREFQRALLEVVAFDHPDSTSTAKKECEALLEHFG